jgi:hypothetical protein
VLELKSAARGVRYAAASPLDETWKRREARIGGSLRVTGPGETGEGSQRKEMGEAGLFFFTGGEAGLLVEGARDRRCCASAHK